MLKPDEDPGLLLNDLLSVYCEDLQFDFCIMFVINNSDV